MTVALPLSARNTTISLLSRRDFNPFLWAAVVFGFGSLALRTKTATSCRNKSASGAGILLREMTSSMPPMILRAYKRRAYKLHAVNSFFILFIMSNNRDSLRFYIFLLLLTLRVTKKYFNT